MTKTKLIFIGLALALVGFLFAGSASAQDGPSISVDPSYVEAAGEHTFTVTGTGWTGSPIAVLPCDYPEGGDPNAVDGDTCDQGSMSVVGALDGDGGFTVEVTLDVPEPGIWVGAGDFARTESAGAGVTVGMMDDMMPATGVNTSLLVIIGTGIALAGVMVFGLSRRLRSL
ncbi:MAG: hypothetical protein OXH53_08515 [bacterium]|nr:hypothetical protein [bacterium]MCY3633401.1 hypothetical protein [bacterium]